MATSYKTPGVYVEEISKFPPSVAEVETAIPAFIGYTSFARKETEGDLIKNPTRITSLLEFEQYFGKEPAYTSFSVKLDDSLVPVDKDTTVTNSKYQLYDSIRLFYDNGGGPCYIVSVGDYNAAISLNKLKDGLEELKKFDEPTLILFPDATSLDSAELGALQQAALLQCGTLGDRFVIMDVKNLEGKDMRGDIDEFRNNVGMIYLKYGAAYHPHVKTVYDKTFRYRDINKNLKNSSGTSVSMAQITNPAWLDEKGNKIKDRVLALDKMVDDNDKIAASFKNLLTTLATASLDAGFKDKLTDLQNASGSKLTPAKNVFGYLWEVLIGLDGLLATNSDSAFKLITHAEFLASVKTYIDTNVKAGMQKLVDLDCEVFNPGAEIFSSGNTYSSGKFKSASLAGMAATAVDKPSYINAATEAEKIAECISVLRDVFGIVNLALNSIMRMGVAYEEMMESVLIPYLPFYKGILKALKAKVNVLPPSAAIAGIYAYTDNTRGVWKAPANMSVNSINGLSEFIDDAVQEDMNIDSNSGKSVNALRMFTGKGFMVWGARTLAGNDNEWRYVPVRRLFNFVEESCKKSTAWVVFEPNDANTWVKVKGQIENFLYNLWRRGALAGAKPEHAYYVNVGLNITMNAQDILEGRLIVEIGMAAVRPAEFIILRFSHKLQQS